MATKTVNTNASFHAQQQFRRRITSDVSLIESCWWDGEPVVCPRRYYEEARLYQGPLCDDVVMFAVESGVTTCDWIIKTVICAENVIWHREGDADE